MLYFRPGEQKNFGIVLRLRGWKYFLLAFIDVEANFLVITAYQYTNITSIQVRLYRVLCYIYTLDPRLVHHPGGDGPLVAVPLGPLSSKPHQRYWDLPGWDSDHHLR